MSTINSTHYTSEPYCDLSTILTTLRELQSEISHISKIVENLTPPEKDKSRFIHSANRYRRPVNPPYLIDYMLKIVERLKSNGKIRTSETYYCTICSFRKFLASTHQKASLHHSKTMMDLPMSELTSELMERYEAWHTMRGNSLNTSSFYMRILRAAYNRAVDDELIADRRPFRHVYTGIEKTTKRALSVDTIRMLHSLDLSGRPAIDHARDIFMLSFFLRGMSFIDMAYLRKSDLINGRLTYRRQKTGQQLVIEWTEEMQTILNKYPANQSDYLLPIIVNRNVEPRQEYLRCGNRINYNLKKIAGMSGIQQPLTLYVARHSWASIAKTRGIPLSVIAEGMGHDNEATTRIYLASLDTSIVDSANRKIIELV